MGAPSAAARWTDKDHRVFRTAVVVGSKRRAPADPLGQSRRLTQVYGSMVLAIDGAGTNAELLRSQGDGRWPLKTLIILASFCQNWVMQLGLFSCLRFSPSETNSFL